ncbi:CaiB/BaiF CoA transferase family protein [Neoaquamicrobium sediminum]|uniref:CaiB/BaiF CoA transferase family protein n=1 Tax=Neoaquamicrobium sediminum TaxID=1849104 RepID=UPI001564C95C|nr:CaiB/BaiF CoA-transferase family protein [Mesorhizobium sediminum]NRC55879.1 CoA transferase [Mesorhizobium sediminum]
MEGAARKTGPLTGFTVIEMAGLGPVPHAGLMLAELGARVVRVERLAKEQAFLNLPPQYDLDRHGREIIRIDLKRAEGTALIMRLAAGADAILEGFRPGVMERLGLGPEPLLAANPRLVYGRMTGFGQDGPLAARAGHDLTYLALSGVLHTIGPKDGKPVPPLNLAADYGGGTMFLIMGVLAALLEASRSGKGQVVDAAMIDGASMLAAPFFAFMAAGIWQDRRGVNLLDSGTPFYDTYTCADGRHVAVACLEPQFFAEFCRLLPLDERFARAQYDQSLWPDMRAAIASRIAERPRDDWAALFEPTDACVAPVLSLGEAPAHPHNRARRTHVETDGLTRPAPAPRFSRTITTVSPQALRDSAATLRAFGIDESEAEHLASEGIVGR